MANAPMNLKIDQAATFKALVFLSCEPKYKFGSTTDVETTKDGRTKWSIELLGAAYDGFGGTNNSVIKVGMASTSNPAEGVQPFSPVELGGFEVGVMERTKSTEGGGEKVVGVTVWYRASELKMAGQAAPAPAPASSSATSASTAKAAA
ncbi:hypothetical protein [Prauserella halophila]|uniref:hypothetical protein n=1 Tax=Prauserella halophila TaxID=185641 RepID=UPI0020A4DB36|nr:hypothetical protein [Prauserella halophila]MCP2234233.1 hypothetical protein [Prauserella halophila]